MAGQLEDKVGLVTGSASGIGMATALAFAKDGAKVLVADVDIEGGQQTVRKIREAGGEAIFVMADVTKTLDIEAMVRKAVDMYGRLDCAFNNAGIVRMGSTVDCTEEDWDLTISINLKGIWLCMKYEIPQMLKQGRGAIVNMSSMSGLIASPGYVAYIGSKHGVIGLTKAAALEYAQAGIRVNAVCPGITVTPFTKPIWSNQEVADSMLRQHPVRRFGKPEEIAEAVVWLCSDAASFVTGAALPVDGGVVAGKD